MSKASTYVQQVHLRTTEVVEEEEAYEQIESAWEDGYEVGYADKKSETRTGSISVTLHLDTNADARALALFLGLTQLNDRDEILYSEYGSRYLDEHF